MVISRCSQRGYRFIREMNSANRRVNQARHDCNGHAVCGGDIAYDQLSATGRSSICSVSAITSTVRRLVPSCAVHVRPWSLPSM